MSDPLSIVLGWLFGTLTPGIADAIRQPKRRSALAKALRADFDELRYKLALVADRMRARTGTMDEASLALIREVIESYRGTEADRAFQQSFGKLLARGTATYIAAHNEMKGKGSPYPVRYELPFLDAHLQDLDMFDATAQSAVLRVRGEFHLFNEQVDQTRAFHDRSYTVAAVNHAGNTQNYEESLGQLAYRAEALIRAINSANDELS